MNWGWGIWLHITIHLIQDAVMLQKASPEIFSVGVMPGTSGGKNKLLFLRISFICGRQYLLSIGLSIWFCTVSQGNLLLIHWFLKTKKRETVALVVVCCSCLTDPCFGWILHQIPFIFTPPGWERSKLKSKWYVQQCPWFQKHNWTCFSESSVGPSVS